MRDEDEKTMLLLRAELRMAVQDADWDWRVTLLMSREGEEMQRRVRVLRIAPSVLGCCSFA